VHIEKAGLCIAGGWNISHYSSTGLIICQVYFITTSAAITVIKLHLPEVLTSRSPPLAFKFQILIYVNEERSPNAHICSTAFIIVNASTAVDPIASADGSE